MSSRLLGSGIKSSSGYQYPLGYILLSIRSCSKFLVYADDLLDCELVAFVDFVRRLEGVDERLELIAEASSGSRHPRKWQRSGPPRVANRARLVVLSSAEVGGLATELKLFRRSSSRSARGVSQNLDRLSQNDGVKLDGLRTALDLVFVADEPCCLWSMGGFAFLALWSLEDGSSKRFRFLSRNCAMYEAWLNGGSGRRRPVLC